MMMNSNDQVNEEFVEIQDEEGQSMLHIKLKIQHKIRSITKEAVKTYINTFIEQFMNKVDIILISLLIIWFALFLVGNIKREGKHNCPLVLQQVTSDEHSTIGDKENEKYNNALKGKGEDSSRVNDAFQNKDQIDNKNETLNVLLKLLNDDDAGDDSQDEEELQYQQQDEQNAQGSMFKISTSPFDPQVKLAIQQKREKHAQRSQSFRKWQTMPKFQNLKFSNYNLQTAYSDVPQEQVINKQEKDKMQQKYAISEFDKELSICTIIYANPNANKQYMHEYAFNSLLHQAYQHHKIVFIADGHQRQKMAEVQRYIQQINVYHNIYLIWNPQRKYAIQSIIIGIKTHCLNSDIISLMHGSDEILGKYVYTTINSMYMKYDSKIVYSNSIKYHQKLDRMESGSSQPYQNDEKNHNSYRKTYKKYGYTFTFWTKLFGFIKDDSLKDTNGYYYQEAGEDALIYSLLELSCGQVYYLPEYNYLEYDQQIDDQSARLRKDNMEDIKKKPSYSCYKKYE